jgi:hypothetical protein
MPKKRPRPTNNNAESIDRWNDEGGAPSGGRVTGKPRTVVKEVSPAKPAAKGELAPAKPEAEPKGESEPGQKSDKGKDEK